MGVVYSCFELVNKSLNEEVTTNNNGMITTTKKNPFISGLAISGAVLILVLYLDEGKGMISKSFGRVCLDCEKSIK